MAAYPGISFVVEDGGGYVDSNSYVSLADANTYWTQHGGPNWTAITDTTLQQYHLIQATQSIDILYGQEYYSIPLSQGTSTPQVPYLQGLLYPRFVQVINNIQVLQSRYIPVQLKAAVCEVAMMSLNGQDIFPQPNQIKFAINKQVKVGGISTSISFGRQVDAERYPGFWKIDKLLYPLLRKNKTPSYLSM